MLAVVLGSLDLLGRRIGNGDARAHRYVEAATDGAKRAALLTERLLAFSRQQPLRPEPIDANALVTGMSDLLRHSLGRDVRLETMLAQGLWHTHADQNQLENALLKVLFTTGYARDGIVNDGAFDPGVELIGKPFTIEQLTAKLREMLDSAAPKT